MQSLLAILASWFTLELPLQEERHLILLIGPLALLARG